MQQGIPENIIDEIRQRTDLVSLIGGYLKLERKGKNYVGLCPFHSEKTPSFTVSPDKQLYHCFGCGTSGNVFSLIMEMEKLTFPEAVRFLALQAGVSIPETKKISSVEENLKEKLYSVNQLAARFYSYCLTESPAGKKALEYLQKRGINREIVELFKLGYAPDGWTVFYDFACKKGIKPGLLIKAGLVAAGKNKGYYDRFRNRIIFPIYSLGGKITGFGGRAIEGDSQEGPKYLNSPETPVFDKGTLLYGLNLARQQMRQEKKAIVMEGYTDVITAFQFGIKNAVASLGTALTSSQARLLRSQADTVITAYDSDSAGESATWRGLAILQESGCLVQVADLPEGSDPDSYIREKGTDSFLEVINSARPMMEYRLRQLKNRYDLTTDSGRIHYTAELMEILPSAVNYVEQDYYLKRAAEDLGVDESSLRSELKKRRSRKSRYQHDARENLDKGQEQISINPAERVIISLMLQSKEVVEQGRIILETVYISDSRVRQIIETILEISRDEAVLSAEKLINQFEDPAVKKVIVSAATDPALQDLEPQTAKRMFEDSVDKLQQTWIKCKQQELQKKREDLETRGLFEEAKKLLLEQQKLIKNINGN